MTPNPAIVNSVEQLGYRVTVGDVASKAGLDINLAQQGLLALASEASANLQVSQTGEIVYAFPKNFRTIIRNKYWQIQVKEFFGKIWKILFYLIRISFGIVLIASILLMFIAIAAILIAASFNNDNDNNSGGGERSSSNGGFVFFAPNFWITPDMFGIFDPNYDNRRYSEDPESPKKINFLQSIFSFLFGDGNPNPNIDRYRWQQIGTVITNNGGAVIAEQIAPYLDPSQLTSQDNEDYMIPVLARFNGYPEVSPEGEIIYYFSDLQVTAKKRTYQPIQAYLEEQLWRFSQADSGQIMLAIGLGALNFIFALVLGHLLKQNIGENLGDFVGFVNSIYYILLGYASSFLTIPLVRYFWLQSRNTKIKQRNLCRQEKAAILEPSNSSLKRKLEFARNFAKTQVIGTQDLIYTTETDLLTQNLTRADEIDQEWRQRLESENPKPKDEDS